VIPMSAMTAVLLTFMRLSGDNEIIAIKTGGASLYALLPPVLLFSLLGCAATLFMTVFGAAWGLTAGNELAYRIAVSHADIGLKERTFNNSFNGVMLYVGAFNKQNNELIDVVSTVVAHRGRLFSNPQTLVYLLRLYNGTIIQTGVEKRSAHSVQFETYDLRLDINQAVSVAKYSKRKRYMMHFGELLNYIREKSRDTDKTEYYKGLVELNKKFSIPFACICLGLLAVPVGIQTRKAKRSTGLVFALILFLLYYLLLTGGIIVSESGLVLPWVGMWIPNLIMGSLALLLLMRTVKERSFDLRTPRFRRKDP
jgi:lipopolysaccharide export system permease protein